mgnify:CR=1 FL=1
MGKSLNITLPKTAFVNRKEQKMKTKLNQSKLKLAIVSAMLVGSAGFSATSYAATATGTMAVSTSVLMSCNISTTAMTFASYDPTATVDLDTTATITSTCTAGGAAVITMGQGTNPQSGSSTAAPVRAMSSGGDFPEILLYQLSMGSAEGAVWGDTDATGKAITADGTAQPFTVYGRIGKNQTVSSGAFTDSVTVTLSY